MDGKIVADFIAGNMIQGVGLQTAPDPNGDIWFEVTQDGTLTARKGVIGGCEIQNGVLQIKNANIEEVLTGHTLKGSIIEGSQFISTPVEVTNDDGNKETKSLFEVTKEGQVYIRAEAIINKLKVSQLETDSIVLSGKAYGLGSLDDIGSNEDAENAFRVNNSTGLLEARNALIRGTIYANTGEIAGLVLETQSLSNETSKVIRTKDSQNNAAFEIRVSNAGSSISILTLNCKDGNFVNSIYTKTLYAGAIQLANTSLYVSNKRVMSFEYTQEGETVTAYLENNWGSRDITIKIKDSSGNAYTLKQRKTFYFKIHFTWGGWSEIKSMTIDVGNSGKTQTFPSAFIGYDDSQFIDSGTKELHFHDSDAVYLDFLRHISPYNGNTYDIGSEKYKWRNLYLDGYIMVGDKKFLLYADGSTARLRLVT